MNVQVKDKFTVKYKRKEHPNARKYPGKPSMEFGTALRKFLTDLNAQERDDFQKGELVFEEEASAEFFDSIEAGDVIGIGLLYGIKEPLFNKEGTPCTYLFEVLEIDKEADLMKARNVTFRDKDGNVDEEICGQKVELAFEDLSAALGLGFGEILERDGKPFGVSEEIEQEVLVLGKKEEEEKEEEKKPTKKKKTTKSKKKVAEN